MPAETMTLQSVGRYDLVHKIAEGGMGAVYKARHRDTGMFVAIKIVPPNLARNQVLLKRFEQEFRAASVLDHPNIVRALDYGYHGDTPYLVMEFVDGESLGQRIDRVGRLPEQEAIQIIAQVAQGLYKAHIQGLVHRDVKPDNILVTKDGVAKLTDMGLVKEVEADLNLTRTGRGLGTPHFMAPEQFRNAKNANARCDVYSLAATLYMAVTGELPFRSCSPLDAWMKKVQNDFPGPKQLFPGLSDRTDVAIRRAMAADPEARPASCKEFVDDLVGSATSRLSSSSRTATGGQSDQWYLRYQDDTGAVNTVKGSLNAIRRCLKEGLLGSADNVRVSRAKTGPFEPLLAQPEFQDLLAGLHAPPSTTPTVGPGMLLDTGTKSSRPPGFGAPAVPPPPPPLGSGVRGPQGGSVPPPPGSALHRPGLPPVPPPPGSAVHRPTMPPVAPIGGGPMNPPGSAFRRPTMPPPPSGSAVHRPSLSPLGPIAGQPAPMPINAPGFGNHDVAAGHHNTPYPPPGSFKPGSLPPGSGVVQGGFRTPAIEIAPVSPPPPSPWAGLLTTLLTWFMVLGAAAVACAASLWYFKILKF